MADVQTGEAARRLGVTTQWVGQLIGAGRLNARSEQRGKRSVWLVDQRSIEQYLAQHGRGRRRRRQPALTKRKLEAELVALRDAFEAAGLTRGATPLDADTREIERERDDLRAEVTTLRDALARSREASELHHQADEERAAVIKHLAAAAAASERADALRRRALTELEEALAVALGPGHLGDLG